VAYLDGKNIEAFTVEQYEAGSVLEQVVGKPGEDIAQLRGRE
jgi:hypothetical protein